MTVWDWIGWIVVATLVWHEWPIWYGFLRKRTLRDMPALGPNDGDAPMVSVIVPARDEAAAVEAALRSILAIDYPNYEVIAVNDRSADGTGEIMDRVAGTDPRCRVLHITGLPSGWLGKNHANMVGARQARGEYLLFTDGDVVFQPPVLRHAVRFMRDGKVDHLTLFPEMPATGFWQALLMSHFFVLFAIITRHPLARFRRFRRAYIGIGAFNMVRRSAYKAIGEHKRLRMEVADDLMFGKLVKDAGFAQDVLPGRGLAWVRWQHGLRGLIRGLEKNVFAGTRYSLPVVVAGVAAELLFAFVPPVMAITGPAPLPWGIACAFMLGTSAVSAMATGFTPLVAPLYPVAHVLFAYVLARSTCITLRDGGVTWRDTFYPLAELRRGMV